MNPHLDELIELCRHPKIQERRGEWQVGDVIYGATQFGTVIVVDRFSLTVSFPTAYTTIEKEIIAQPPRHIWVLPLSDPLRPERSLMGYFGNPPTLFYRFSDRQWICETYNNDHQRSGVFNGPTPEIAVAKAIIAQEEV